MLHPLYDPLIMSDNAKCEVRPNGQKEQKVSHMKEAIKVSPIELVSNTEAIKGIFRQFHEGLTKGITNKNRFQALVPEIITPNLVALHGNRSQGQALNEITDYVESLIPTIDVPDTREEIHNGKIVKVQLKDANGNLLFKKEKAFVMDGNGYSTIRRLVDKSFAPLSVYWDARSFVEGACKTIDEGMFDKMNDYLWRKVMAVVFPEDVKREFKHLCITIKRKLYYLGDRNKVHNQTLFGLYDLDKGGCGKTTMLEGFANAFSNGNPEITSGLERWFEFNATSADKYGVLFVDENSRGASSVKDNLKQFVDSSLRKVEAKGVDAQYVNNLLTIVVSSNQKISSRLYEDEARGQRRDATFEVIGLLQQYNTDDMTRWFKKMFEVCPIEDDYKTYHHRNPHSDELTDAEYTVLSKIHKLGRLDNCYKIGQLSDILELRSKTPQWYALKTILKLDRYFETRIDKDKSKYYAPKYDAIAERIGCVKVESKDWWNRDWRDTRPFLDVEGVIADLEANKDYDTTAPIDYAEYEADANGRRD